MVANAGKRIKLAVIGLAQTVPDVLIVLIGIDRALIASHGLERKTAMTDQTRTDLVRTDLVQTDLVQIGLVQIVRAQIASVAPVGKTDPVQIGRIAETDRAQIGLAWIDRIVETGPVQIA